MPILHAIQIFGFINFFIIGLSLLLRSQQWSGFFAWLAREGEAGALAYGFICLSFGSLLVAFHRNWQGPMTVLTLAGWLEVALGFVCLLSPSTGLGIVSWAAQHRPGACRMGGLLCLIVAVIMAIALIQSGEFVF